MNLEIQVTILHVFKTFNEWDKRSVKRLVIPFLHDATFYADRMGNVINDVYTASDAEVRGFFPITFFRIEKTKGVLKD